MRIAIPSLVFLIFTAPAFAEVTAIEDVRRNQPVTVAGTVERFHDEDEIRLRDETGSIRVYLGPQPLQLELGQSIQVSGFMDGNLIRNELYAREIVLEDGTVVTIERGYE
ncbi:hypothetical protein [Tateyamaria omphalii]|uniref:Bacterial OB-fold domain-containing protein n=1 Tax=Tateyamaria omphalii TaxID=299262 RepID=A0A1P8MW42_9RHOB|nr:hypothetical protein [Tateyamaria omphalii]APX12223.1 hypothetical protein BWR18_11445 [Tateyamaria omphalii]